MPDIILCRIFAFLQDQEKNRKLCLENYKTQEKAKKIWTFSRICITRDFQMPFQNDQIYSNFLETLKWRHFKTTDITVNAYRSQKKVTSPLQQKAVSVPKVSISFIIFSRKDRNRSLQSMRLEPAPLLRKRIYQESNYSLIRNWTGETRELRS